MALRYPTRLRHWPRHSLTTFIATLTALLFWLGLASPVSAQNGVTVAGGNNLAANQLYGPSGIYVDGSGTMYITDEGNHRVQKWLPGAVVGITVAGGNGYGNAANQLYGPTGVYVDGAGAVYVADSYNNRVQKWLPGANTGITVAGGNGSGFASNQLSHPTCIYVDAIGTIYVTDRYYSPRIQKWLPGAITGVTFAYTGYNPTGMYVDESGTVWVYFKTTRLVF